MMKVTLRKANVLRCACMCIHIDLDRADEALHFVNDILTKRGPTHNPDLRGINHVVTDARSLGLILVDFPDWDTEAWAGSWDDLRIMACQIADHLNLEAETDK